MGGLRLDMSLSLSGGASFSPSSLFGASDQGVVFDFTSISSLYQTDDTSSPVTATGQAIGRINDLSGKGNHATQATAAARPTYQGHGSFDGTDDTLVTGAIDLSGSDKATVIASVRETTDIAAIVVQVANFAGSGFLRVDAASFTRGELNGSTAAAIVDTTGPALNADAVLATLFDIGGATATDEVKVRLNGAEPAQTVITAGPAGAGNFNATQPIRISSNSAAAFFPGRVYRVIVINRLLSGSDLSNAEQWCATGAGMTL